MHSFFPYFRYRKDDVIGYSYVDVTPQGADSFEVQDLKVGTKYTFAIMAFNSIGSSDFTPEIAKVETKSKILFFASFCTSVPGIVIELIE